MERRGPGNVVNSLASSVAACLLARLSAAGPAPPQGLPRPGEAARGRRGGASLNVAPTGRVPEKWREPVHCPGD